MDEQGGTHRDGGGRGRTAAIVVAILLAGAMVAGAIVYVSIQGRPRVVTTTSAQTAWEYASAGWSCELHQPDGATSMPITVDLLEVFATAENAGGTDFWDTTPADDSVACTESGG